MKLSKIATALAASAGLASAAPAIVWKSGGPSSPNGPSHISDAIDSRSLLSSVLGNDGERDDPSSSSPSSALAAVVFLVGRDDDGSEGLASLASSGKIPGVRGRYLTADEVHHHVRGMESARTVARDAREADRGAGTGATRVAQVSMEEFRRKLASMAQTEAEEGGDSGTKISMAERRRRMDISEADVLVVSVGANEDASKIDAAVLAAIDSSAVRTVVLSSVRSAAEVKHARVLAVGERFARKEASNDKASRRRLQEGDAAEASAEGVYYVNMTPNIFAGLLFFFMFTFTAYTGLMCMNMIEGQDVYVKKYPHIGREV